MIGSTLCHCGCGKDIDTRFIIPLQSLEREMKSKLGQEYEMRLNCGARCEKHNSEIGASKNSAHTLGLAGDIHFDNSRVLYVILNHLFSIGCHRIGINFNQSFVHFDIASGLKVPYPKDGLEYYPVNVVFKYS